MLFSKKCDPLSDEKMVRESKISKKGQITIPKDTREKLGVKTGDTIIFESASQGVLIQKKGNPETDKNLNEINEMWKDHPLFKEKNIKDILEKFRGPEHES